MGKIPCFIFLYVVVFFVVFFKSLLLYVFKLQDMHWSLFGNRGDEEKRVNFMNKSCVEKQTVAVSKSIHSIFNANLS